MTLETLESRLEAAFALRKEGKLDDAIRSFRDLDTQFPAHPAVTGMLGICLYENRQMAEAKEVLSKAVGLQPKAKTLSLSLFHSLWSLDMRAEALAEARRFKQLTGSDEYDEILADYSA